ncbi:MAG: AraC family transcriptional regulator [Butyricicoccus pullicaecorum]|jgi:AraC-like DNA-binding protein|nr:AraC family transcriptional regulator [Butyricicoccus pullicaecorum]
MENSNVLQLQHQIFSDFYLCYCGYATCDPLQHFGPAVRPNYLIYVVLDGKGVFQSGGNRVSLHAGEGFLIRPNEQVFFQADDVSPWTYLWIGFDGARCKEYLQAIGLADGQQTFRTPDGEAMKDIVLEMLRYNTASTEHDFLLQGLLCRFFACLAHSLSIPLSAVAKNDRENFYVRRAVEFVQYNYANHITVSDMAKYVSLNRSYLFTLFQRVLRISPQEFLTTFRLTRAKEQLTLTDATVAAIAQSVGYRDPLVFSKAFKQMTGMTPVQFRKKTREEGGIDHSPHRRPRP